VEIMADKNIGALLVMEDADLCGVFSERDYARKLISQGRASRKTTVGKIMTSPPTVVSLEQSVDDCLRMMTDRRVRHLPVVSYQAVIGVLSIGDLVNRVILRQEDYIIT